MEDFIRHRISDLAQQADRTGSFTFSPFLNEAELADYYALAPSLPNCGVTVWGGVADASRVMLRFGDPERLGYEVPFPIVCLKISPLQEKYADDLTHRDFLGAVMHLGLERDVIGDILVTAKTAFLFCQETVADYLCGELSRVRHTAVKCEPVSDAPEHLRPKYEEQTHQTASLRIDGVIAKVCRLSRSDCLTLFRAKKVFLNGRCTENSSTLLKEGDGVSVRGYGKFRFAGTAGTTRKGNLIIRTAHCTGYETDAGENGANAL
ncbi:MAG: hypothetical protein J6Z45_03720 [Oscillospiraceae bacterium]|nr:hypothetical protein [Oscillospiraceae bacterium]